MKNYSFFIALFLAGFQLSAQEPGQPLPAWEEGMLDLHHINTGRGDAAFYILPDGTTMLVDAGEMDPTHPRTLSPRNAVIHPNDSKTASEWIAWYVKKVMPAGKSPKIDYALITHFHDDHFGVYHEGAKNSKNGDYVCTGITGVGDEVKIGKLIDRGYPDYNFPVDLKKSLQEKATKNKEAEKDLKTMENYWNFIDFHTNNSGMKAEKLIAGRNDQITLINKPEEFKNFKVQNVKSNGTIWTGKGTSTIEHFPGQENGNLKYIPGENPLSLAYLIEYGNFRFYNGGDNPGIADLGTPEWNDVGTSIARAVGEVDVAVMDHHGNRDSHNEFNIKTLRPRVWIQQTWSSDHPGHEVLRRVTSEYLYPGPRDMFATNMLEPNKQVIGPSLENSYKSLDGHIVLRVMPGGNEYFVIILNDENEENEINAVFGPYQSKKKQPIKN
ncbi:hypothetical protein BH23BAC1_BH23BAC1_07490 [soil metagenome]